MKVLIFNFLNHLYNFINTAILIIKYFHTEIYNQISGLQGY